MTPAERILAAADHIDAMAVETSPAERWVAYVSKNIRRSPKTGRPLVHRPEWGTTGSVDQVISCDGAYGTMIGPDAIWIATMSPAIAEELSYLLVKVRDDIHEHGWDEADAIHVTALALADLILREDVVVDD